LHWLSRYRRRWNVGCRVLRKIRHALPFGVIEARRVFALAIDWRREIDDALRNSHIVLVLVTRIARQSEYVTYEWAFALGAGVKVVPIVVDKQALHPRLAAF
jgi:TIR domain